MITQARLIEIGEARGLTIPQAMITKYGLGEEVIIEEIDGGLFIHGKTGPKLSWEDTYKRMAAEKEDWTDWHDFYDEDNL